MSQFAGVLSRETLERVARIVHDEALAQRDCQLQKKALTDFNKDFCAMNAFSRIDTQAKGYINSLDLVQFFRDQNKIIPEADTYMLISAFDSNQDGRLSLIDFGKMVCPVGYGQRQDIRTTKQHYDYAMDNSKLELGHDVDHGIIRICEREISAVRKVEALKQELMSFPDYSMLEIFRSIDQFAHGYINQDNLRVFFKGFDFCIDLDEEDILHWIRRYDRDVDRQLDYSDFVRALGPYCQYTQKAEMNQPGSTAQRDSTRMPEQQEDDEILNSYNKIDASSERLPNVKATSAKQMHSGRALSRLTKTTAASINATKAEQFGGGGFGGRGSAVAQSMYAKSEKPKQRLIKKKAGKAGAASQGARFTSMSAVVNMTKPQSAFNEKQKHMKTAGEILNYPYSFDQDATDDAAQALDNRLAKQRYEEQYRVAEIQNQQLYSPIREDFQGAQQFSQALFDMTEIEGELEKKRRELVLRSDFNLCDVFKMFGGLSKGKRGIDCDDLYGTITANLDLTITKDEVFIMFYKLDKDGDGLIDYNEFSDCFTPRSHEYSVLLQSRGGFYGAESDFKKYFQGPTRELLKVFIKGFVDCEVSIELVRQRISNKLRINNYTAFAAMDEHSRGCLSVDDFRSFIKKANLYPVDKNLLLLFERFDKSKADFVKYEDFVAAVTPFNTNEAF